MRHYLKKNIKYSEFKNIFDQIADLYHPEPLYKRRDALTKLISAVDNDYAAMALIEIFFNSQDRIKLQFGKNKYYSWAETGIGFWAYDLQQLIQWVWDNGGSIDYDIDGIMENDKH